MWGSAVWCCWECKSGLSSLTELLSCRFLLGHCPLSGHEDVNMSAVKDRKLLVLWKGIKSWLSHLHITIILPTRITEYHASRILMSSELYVCVCVCVYVCVCVWCVCVYVHVCVCVVCVCGVCLCVGVHVCVCGVCMWCVCVCVCLPFSLSVRPFQVWINWLILQYFEW